MIRSLAINHLVELMFMVKIDSMIQCLCLRHCVPNGLSYPDEETWLTLCINNAKLRSGVKDLYEINISCYTELQALRLH